jgi:hypothetical protein
MIVIKIELWPHGDESKCREIGRAIIANIGGTPEFGVYQAELLKSAEYANSQNVGAVYKRGIVEGFSRKSGSPWRLLKLALEACGV